MEILWCFSFFCCISHFRFVQALRFYATHLRNQCIAPNRSANKLKGFAYILAPLPGSFCICTIVYLYTLPTPAASCNCIFAYTTYASVQQGGNQFLFASPSVCSASDLSRANYYTFIFVVAFACSDRKYLNSN